MAFTPQSTSIATWRERKAAERLAELRLVETPRPIVLVPTPAQLARGQRVIDATDEQMPKTCRALVAKLTAAGVAHRVTYAHALLPPVRGSDDWVDNHSVVIRVRGRGFTSWDNGAFAGAVWDWRKVGATEFAARALGGDYTPPERKEVATALCLVPGCGKTVRIKADGAPYAHRCAADGASMDSQGGAAVRYMA